MRRFKRDTTLKGFSAALGRMARNGLFDRNSAQFAKADFATFVSPEG
jgi:hypothetical protein